MVKRKKKEKPDGGEVVVRQRKERRENWGKNKNEKDRVFSAMFVQG